MKLLLILAWRNIWRKKRRTLITVSAVLFAVILSIALMSLISGTREQMVGSIISNTTGHLQIQDALYYDEPSMDHSLEFGDDIKSILAGHSEMIDYIVPRLQGFCLVAKDIGTRGVFVMGIMPEKEEKMNGLSSRIIKGNMFSNDDDYAVVAAGVASLLGLTIGDTLMLLGQGFQGITATGKYQVGGIVEFPVPEQNNSMVYLPLREAQWLFAAPERLNNLILMVRSEAIVPDLAESLRNELDDEWFAVKTWQELMPDTVAALEARDAQVKIFAWILYIVAGFGIFGTVITMMHERLREFGITMSIGLKRAQLSAICMIETIMISILGVMAGIAIGYPIMYWLYRNPIQLSGELADVMLDMGFEPVMPFSIAPNIFIYQGITIFIIALIIGIYPVRKIFSLDIISASRK
jgi:putative ABC transport system permease protein